ncbi:MAG: leucyl/phenylalanyl-tRNA--protein transferase [Chromatiales bacterium]|nr:leucyl/phenylalanyl-tRNA--protein transferase [Chromatiales bacterium]
MPGLAFIPPGSPPDRFPDPGEALSDPPGLLAAGGDLSPERLLAAYRRGIFPWYQAGQPVLWWSPDPRAVLEPARFHLSRRLRRELRQRDWTVTADRGFAEVLAGCTEGRPDTWLTAEMRAAYLRLHGLGHAHSVEIRSGGRLIGGLYGLSLGAVFFAESMFSRQASASKAALFALCRLSRGLGIELLDCQLPNPHLLRLGVSCEPRSAFLGRLAQLVGRPPQDRWPPGPFAVSSLLPD